MIAKKNRILIFVILVVMLCTSLCSISYGNSNEAESSDYSLEKIKGTWKSLSDEELNQYIGNNNDTELFLFMASLSEAEEKQLLARDTMLNNTISIDNGDGTFDKMPYYKWIKKVGSETEPAVFSRTRGVASQFTAKTGYCFYRFVDNNSGYIVRYKVTFTLNSTANAESLTNDYTVGSVIYVTSGTNSNNTSLDEVTFAKQKKYMQKAATSHEVLGDGTTGTNAEGNKVYRTAITPVFVLTVKVKKPAYTYGSWQVSDFVSGGVAQEMANGSRFNFKEYNWTNTGDSTFDNKVYHQEETDTLTSCVNILSCGFTVDNVASLGLAEGVPEIDTINVVYKHPELKVNYYVNGGTVKSTSYNESAENPVTRSILYNNKYNSTYGLPEVPALGFSKEGYAAKVGAEWKTSDGSTTWDEAETSYKATDIKDFTDGTYFTYNVRDMYVNWLGKVYKVTLDNQGANEPGTEYTWYRYNSYETVTKADGTTQNNYFYTSAELTTPLRDGYKITNPVKEGYIFKGYFSEKNGQGTQYVTASGSFTNKLWKIIGPHTIYAYWVEKPPELGTLTIQQNIDKDDFHKSHGDPVFVYKITSQDDDGKVYYRTISFEASDMSTAKNGVVTKGTECVLPYGSYTVEALDVYRYENVLSSISSGEKVSEIKGSFQMSSSCEEVLAVYTADKTKWDKFSHNDLVINSLSD